MEIEAVPSGSFLFEILMSLYLEFSQQYTQAADFATNAWKRNGKNEMETLMALSRLLTCYFKIGLHEKALTALHELPTNELNEQNLYWIHSIRNNEAMIQIELGNYDLGAQIARNAVKLAKMLGDQKKLGHSLNTLAIALEWSGKIELAKKTYQETLKIKQEANDELGYAITLCNLGALMSNLENPKDSEQMYLEALTIFQKHERISNIAKTHELMGFIQTKMGRQEPAISHYQQAVHLAQTLDNEFLKATTLKSLIGCLASAGKIKQAEELLPQLKDIVKNEGFSSLENSIKLIEASILKQKPRTSNKVRAQEIYRNLLSQPTSYEISFASLTNLIELGILEWEDYANEEERNLIAQELESMLDILEKEIANYDSNGLLAEFLFFKGKINCLWGNIKEGLILLNQSSQIAQADGWSQLESKAKHAIENIKRGSFHFTPSDFSNSVQQLNLHLASFSTSLKQNQVDNFYKMLNSRFGQK